jgi:hypothetical protein
VTSAKKLTPSLRPKLPLARIVDAAIDILKRRLDVVDLLRRDNFRGMHSDQLLARITEHPAGAGVGVDVTAPGIGDQDAIGCAFENTW